MDATTTTAQRPKQLAIDNTRLTPYERELLNGAIRQLYYLEASVQRSEKTHYGQPIDAVLFDTNVTLVKLLDSLEGRKH